ncbi:MAG TPA: type II toxin-antitoxin system Phd/YefM family antitoxin [Gemmatimonadaceae bacterium]|nr:type II toxin-antitoxin system Phd/YefM family antitoxin [Gemmatimonadaceae bacterium]
MRKLKPSRDIRPVTEFRANAAQFIEQVQQTGEPIILTQHGKGAAVLLDLEVFESLVEEIEVLRDIRISEAQVAAGEGIPHEEAMNRVRRRPRKFR